MAANPGQTDLKAGLRRETSRPYVDYYRSEQISPVHQDVSNATIHRERRESLYRLLGILPRIVRGSAVLEIGPGSGHNALYTASLGPAKYVFVDANPLGLQECRALLESAYSERPFSFVEGFVEDIPLEATFDLVLAEGLLSAQHNAAELARTIGRHVSSDGLMVITCMDNISYVSEMTRRLIAHRVVPMDVPFKERVEQLVALFTPHLDALSGMSRSYDDWVMDNITHPLPGPLFPIDDAIEALGGEFDVYGSSPDFTVDWRWYKQLHSGNRDDNNRAIRAYRENLLAFLDYRVVPQYVDHGIASEVRTLADHIYRSATGADFGEGIDFDSAINAIVRIAELVADLVPSASIALFECRDILEGRLAFAEARAYATFFGRGQQYLSLTKRAGPRV